MPIPDRFYEDALDLAKRFVSDSHRRKRHRRRRNKRRVRRIVRAVLLLVLITFVLFPALIAAGFFMGPYGFLGIIGAPILIALTWVLVLRLALRTPRVAPLALPASTSDLAQLPEKTESWLDEERAELPAGAQGQVDQIGEKLSQLTHQLRGQPSETVTGAELRRLLGEELPTLVQSYRKLPANVRRQPLYEGPSPEQKLHEGLTIIDAQLGRLQERLAKDDLHALATHQRYLELKYKREDE